MEKQENTYMLITVIVVLLIIFYLLFPNKRKTYNRIIEVIGKFFLSAFIILLILIGICTISIL